MTMPAGARRLVYEIKYAQGGYALQRWHDIAPLLEPAVSVAGGRFEVDDVRDLVIAGRYHLLVVEDDGKIIAAMTARTVHYPRIMALEVSFLGGNGGMLWGRELLEVVEKIARITGCSRVEFRGRKEWGNVLRHDGYQAAGTLYEKVISPCVTEVNGTTGRQHLPS